MESIMTIELGGKTLTVETGKVARQAHGSAMVRLGDTVILATAVEAKDIDEERDWFPLFVDYREKAYAAGKIPGGFFKREGRPSEKETVSARLIDRTLRPLFAEGYSKEVQIMVLVLSSDQENDADALGLLGASVALSISPIPFHHPVGAVRIGRLNGELVTNPTFSELEQSDMDLVVAGTREFVNMMEGECREVSEGDLLSALQFGHEKIKQIVGLQEELKAKLGKPKPEVEIPPENPELVEAVTALGLEKIREANRAVDKLDRQEKLNALLDSVTLELLERFPETERKIKTILEDLEKKDMRQMILEEGKRIDGRGVSEVRPITCEVGILPPLAKVAVELAN